MHDFNPVQPDMWNNKQKKYIFGGLEFYSETQT